MKKNLYFFLLVLLGTLGVSRAWAQEFQQPPLIFTIIEDGVSVRSLGRQISGHITIPATVSDGTTTYNVTAISKEGFEKCANVTGITIPSSVKRIGDGAFYDCTGLTQITIPASVQSIGRGVFHNNTALKIAVIENSNTALEHQNSSSAYYYGNDRMFNMELDSLYLGRPINNETKPGGAAITNAAKKIVIGGGVTSIHDHFTYENDKLQSVELRNNVTTLGKQAFMRCGNLQRISMAAPLTSIGIDCFCHCTSLNDVELPNTLELIDYSAFYNCQALQKITIPKSVSKIGRGAFTYCI